jgi:hypothetical protein
MLILATLLPLSVVTQTKSPPTATASAPTGIVRRTASERGSIRISVRSLEFATHTEPAPKAIPVGALPTRSVSTTVP